MIDPSCAWCKVRPVTDPRARFCGKACRQAAYRLRRLRATPEQIGSPMRMAYADPPYPGKARRYYQNEASYAGEVDHVALIASLEYSYDGWALSTSSEALRDILPRCPARAHVCPWVKPIGVSRSNYGPSNTWEPLIVVPGRELQPGKRDWLLAQPARFGGTLPGRKPIAFVSWMFGLLGLLPGDSLVDLFPGTGIVGACWRELSQAAHDDGHTRGVDDTSHPGYSDASAPSDAKDLGDTSPRTSATRRLVMMSRRSTPATRRGPNHDDST